MADEIKLCRREITQDGKTRLCNQVITKRNAMNWCQAHRLGLPFWPKDDGMDERTENKSLTPNGAVM